MLWRVRLFDGPTLESPSGEQLKRFRSRKIGSLLAYLALKLGHPCPREELADALWPDELDQQVVANRLRVALASLRRQLEPSGVPFGSVLDVSIPTNVCLRSEVVWCDVEEFERLYRQGDKVGASSLAVGTLLPGNYEEWAILERTRLEALIEDLPPAPPVTQPPPAHPPSLHPALPLYLTRFFGRDEEIDHLQSSLSHHRLVVVLGPGGVGKTRLAVETARSLSNPALFVALADLPPDSDVARATLQTARMSPALEDELVDQLISYLVPKGEFLLILDNAEHMVEATADLAVRLLAACPDLRILVTSRRRLDLPGEVLLALQPLTIPSDTDSEAVALFVDRARNARPDFVLSPRSAEAAVAICQILQGMPLALELAAARVTVQTPAQIHEELAKGVTNLRSRQRGLSPRHQSLRASIQGSYDQLSPELQEFFARLSVFQGGWTIEAARAIIGSDEAEWHMEELMASSLVTGSEEGSDGGLRFSFLESIRQFAAEQLEGDEQMELIRRHADYFLALASQVDEDDVRTLPPLDSDLENLQRALQTRSPMWRAALAGALTYAHVRGQHRTFLRWAESALSESALATDAPLRVRLRSACYYIFSFLGRLDRMREVGESIARDEAEYPPAAIVSKLILAYTVNQEGNLNMALSLAEEALKEARMTSDNLLTCRCLRINAWLLTTGTREDQPLDECHRIMLRQAEALSLECLNRLPATSSHLAFEQLTLCYTNHYLGRIEDSYRYLKLAQETALAHGMKSMLVFAFRFESLLAKQRGDLERAALYYGAYLQMRESTGYSPIPRGQESSPIMELAEQMDLPEYEEDVRQGRQTPPHQLVSMKLTSNPIALTDG